MRRALRVVLLWLLPAALAVADDPTPQPPAPPAAPQAPVPLAKPPPPQTVEQAAEAVLAAVKANDDAAMKALAARDDPDPWLVGDGILARGEQAAAEAFAEAVGRQGLEGLAGYVKGRRGKDRDPATREASRSGGVAFAEGRFADALAAFERGRLGEDDVPSIHLDYGRGLALGRLSRRVEAEAVLLSIAERASRIGWWRRAAKALYLAGSSADDRSDYSVALERVRRSLDVAESHGLRLAAEEAHSALGLAHESRGEYEEARKHQEAALRLAGEIGDDEGVEVALENLGNVLPRLGDLAGARSSLQRALALSEQRRDAVSTARVLGNLGTALYSSGEYARALACQERALHAKEALHDPAGIAGALGNLGILYQVLGDPDRALEAEDRALRLKEGLDDRASMAATLGNIAALYQERGELARAGDSLERVRRIQQELGDRAGAALTLGNLALVHLAAGDRDQALAEAETALAEQRVVGHRLGEAKALQDLGVVRAARGEATAALAAFEASAAEAEQVASPDILVRSLWGVAQVRLAEGHAAEAATVAGRAVEALDPVLAGHGDEAAVGIRERTAELFEIGAAAAAVEGDAAGVFRFLEGGRAGALLSALSGREAIAAARIPAALLQGEARARAEETAAVARLRAALDAERRADVAEARRAADVAHTAVRDAVGRIQREAAGAADVVRPRPIGLPALRLLLRPGDVFVEYGLGRLGALAFVATGTDERIVALGASVDVLAAASGLVPVVPGADPAVAIDALRRLVIDPLHIGEGVRRVIVAPVGALSYAPFALLLPGREVSMVPSATTWALLASEVAPRGAGILALGDPDYEGGPPVGGLAASRGGSRLRRLPASADEARAIGTTTLLGKDATEARFAAEVATRARWRGVHFACHGLVDRERPSLCSLALTPSGEDDGFLTALDVFRMKIPSDLAVLSACETGKGKIAKGEGIVGLTRAFMFAGAPRVIVSLWKVDDEATRALMTKFYGLWSPKDGSKGLGTAAALESAQEFVASQEKWKHPYYWAAWVLWGLPD